MKTIPPKCPEPEIGPKYWRSLDQLADTPEFREWLEREFPTGASEFSDPVSRRNFVKVMSASFLLAGLGLTGCRRPEEKIYPFAKQPENYIHGVPQYFATAMPTRRSAIPLVVKSSDGRPTKIEGNPDHPDSNGGTDVFAQASILDLYDPDRSMRFLYNGGIRRRQEALDSLAELSRNLQSKQGDGLSFLLEHSNSPSRARVQELVAKKFPAAKWYTYEPVDLDVAAQAAEMISHQPVRPYYNLDRAQAVLALDCDFLGAEHDTYINCRRFAQGRRLETPKDKMNRLYAVESLFTLTGANADHRLRVNQSMIVAIVARIAEKIIVEGQAKDFQTPLSEIAKPAAEFDKWINPCVKDLLANKGKALVMAGHRLPLAAHLLVSGINEALGANGTTVTFLDKRASSVQEGNIGDLALALKTGHVETLVILGGNPVYNAPQDLIFDEPATDWGKVQGNAKTIIRLGRSEDETSWSEALYASAKQKPNQWDLPAAHYLESWGDARTADGTLVPIQPLIDPLFGGLTEIEVLAMIGGLDKTSAYDITRETFKAILQGDLGTANANVEEIWKKYLHDGFLANSASPVRKSYTDWHAIDTALREINFNPKQVSSQKMDVIFFRDYSVDDGRYNNNGWMQECPDPITKLTWDNAIYVSPKTAHELGVDETHSNQNNKFKNHVLEVTLTDDKGKNPRTVRGPVWIQPGMADNTVGLSLGYGRERTGRIGRGSGYNAYRLRSNNALYLAQGATVTKTADIAVLANTQSHWVMEGRPIVREANLDQYQKNPRFAAGLELERPHVHTEVDGKGEEVFKSLYPNPLDEAKSRAMHQWGMSIDLNSCVGCSACVVACQSENNVPIVGKLMVTKMREMHWLRIDRYYAGQPEDPQAVNQPMFCQHCESAPCENVCPVNATSHDEEGLNVMTYNRCVGTRYCSNNCPYKIRRFNFFDYNRRPLGWDLYKTPLTTFTDGEWEMSRWLKDPDRGSKPEDEWQLVKLVKNPDVSVRMRGVMEKCTFCVQRIEQAKIGAKVAARDTDHIRLSEKEGTVPKTACQQACPAGAIVFGDISDPDSLVSKLKKQERDYSVLDFLNTKPRLTYLAKVRNPNPEMPDYKKYPLTTEEHIEKMGAPEEEGEETPAEKAPAEKGGHHA